MGLSTWPDLELFPLEERPLLQAARLRRFGVNYLQDGEILPMRGRSSPAAGFLTRLISVAPFLSACSRFLQQ